MDDICTYLILLGGQVDEDEVNHQGPLHLAQEEFGPTDTLFSACTDQSGLIGLLRRLHGLGFTLLSVRRAETS